MSISNGSGTKPLRLIGLTRKSRGEDEGTHKAQRENIERRIGMEDALTLLRVENEHKVSGAKNWRDRELGEALAAIKRGEADGVCVDEVDRLTRERMSAAGDIWDEFEKVGAVLIDCKGFDSRDEDGEFDFGLNALLARKQWKQYQRRSNAGRGRAVLDHGVHGGDDAPFGYVWTERADGAKNMSGNAKHGPLDIDPEKAPIAVQVFERRAAGAARKELIQLTGLSDGAVMDMLRNKVYLGIAYSGEFEKNDAHPALITRELFDRVQRTFQRKRPSKVIGRDNSLLSRTLVCGSCGVGHLVHDRSLGSYRCKRDGLCEKPVTITADRIEPYVFHHALSWHAVLNPMYEVETNEALPEVTGALSEALSARDELEADESISTLRRAQALTEVDGMIAQLEQVLAEVEASNGWLGMDTEAVQRRLVADGPVEVKEGHPAPRCSDLRAGNDFIREMVKVVVQPVGRGRKVPVKDRVEVMQLTPSSASVLIPARGEAAAA